MSAELKLVKAFCDDREIEMTHHAYIQYIPNIEREVKALFQLVHSYYDKYGDTLGKNSIPKEELLAWYDLNNPNSKQRDTYFGIIDTVFESSLSNDELVKDILDQTIENHYASAIVEKLLPTMEGHKYGLLKDVPELIDQYNDMLYSPPDNVVVPVPCTLSIEELIKGEIMEVGLPWHLDYITETIGGMRRKTVGLIYAYVDCGKTSFALASAAAFAKELAGTDEKICYCGNEESAPRLRLRFLQAMLNWTRQQIMEDEAGATEVANELGFNNVLIFDGIDTGDQLKYILKEYAPTVAYTDIATDVSIPCSSKVIGVDYQKILFKYYRTMATKHNCAIVCVAQGSPNLENSKYPKLSEVYGSKSGIQGSMDYVLGIGRVVDDRSLDDFRFVNMPKNKLNDGDDGRMKCYFDRKLCKWEHV